MVRQNAIALKVEGYRTLRSEYCQPHLNQLKNLRVTNSKIHESGLGLFSARIPIPKGNAISNYTVIESTQPIHGNYVS